jgi:hypothetical protein
MNSTAWVLVAGGKAYRRVPQSRVCQKWQEYRAALQSI